MTLIIVKKKRQSMKVTITYKKPSVVSSTNSLLEDGEESVKIGKSFIILDIFNLFL